MIRRGESHVIFSRTEIMRRVKQRSTTDLLEQLMWMFEAYSRKRLYESNGHTDLRWDISPDFHALMASTKKWLQEPLVINFGSPSSRGRIENFPFPNLPPVTTEEMGAQESEEERKRERRRQRRLARKAK